MDAPGHMVAGAPGSFVQRPLSIMVKTDPLSSFLA